MSRLLLITDWVEIGRAAHYDGAELASLCGVSSSQLRRFFQQRFCRPPQEWLNELRLWDAIRMLRQKYPVKEIAYTLRFGSVPHFCHRFKEYHGFTPSECKLKLLEDE